MLVPSTRCLLLAIFTALTGLAQQPPPGGPPRPGWDRDGGQGPPRMPHRPPPDHGFHAGPPGRWWTDPGLVQRLGLSSDQQAKIDDLFQRSRLKLIDLRASLQKEEAILEPLLAADHPDEAKILLQIDRIAQARAELEKANARMLLGFRNVLSPEQWKKLQSEGPGPPPDHRR